MLLKVRQKFGHGPSVAYWRDIVRPRILKTRPVTDTTDGRCEIHVLTSKDDWLNLVWALKSFYWASGRKYRLCIHEDGTLASKDIENLRAHFPDARIIERNRADKEMSDYLSSYPRSLHFRQNNLLAPKVFDFVAYLEAERMLLVDSDVLFFDHPSTLTEAIEKSDHRSNLFNQDCGASAYTVAPGPIEQFPGLVLEPEINSGLALIHKASMCRDWVEEFLQLPGILSGHFWRIEQTVYALCSSRFGVGLLPKEYQVRLEKGLGNQPVRHYVGVIRHWMYSEGMRHLVKRGMLQDLA